MAALLSWQIATWDCAEKPSLHRALRQLCEVSKAVVRNGGDPWLKKPRITKSFSALTSGKTERSSAPERARSFRFGFVRSGKWMEGEVSPSVSQATADWLCSMLTLTLPVRRSCMRDFFRLSVDSSFFVFLLMSSSIAYRTLAIFLCSFLGGIANSMR